MSHDKEIDKKQPLLEAENNPTTNELTDEDLDQVAGGLKFGGVEGESTKKGHEGEIEVLAWSKK